VVGATLFTPVRAYLLAASAAAVLATPPQVAPAPTAADLARSIQQKYDTVRDFSAAFEHRYRGGVLRQEAVERGTMQVKKSSACAGRRVARAQGVRRRRHASIPTSPRTSR
jgi:hypothetical protein